MRKNAVVIPSRALIDTQGMKSLFVVGADGVIKSQPVEIAFAVGELTIIKSGLKVGEMVIVDGVRRVKPGMTIKPIVVPMDKQDGVPVPMGQNATDSAATTEGQAG